MVSMGLNVEKELIRLKKVSEEQNYSISDSETMSETLRQAQLDNIKSNVIDHAKEWAEIELNQLKKNESKKTLGDAVGDYIRDLPKKHRISNFFSFGESRIGKSKTLCYWAKRRIDPTFFDDFENRYMLGTQYRKVANYFKAENIVSKLFFWDEIGFGLYSEDHAKMIVKELTKLSQINGYKYSIFFAATTWIKLVTGNTKSQFKYLLPALERLDRYRMTKFDFKVNEQAVRYASYGEAIHYLKEIDFKLPKEYTIGTAAEGYNAVIKPLYLHMPTKEIERMIDDADVRWKNQAEKEGAEELLKMESDKRSDDTYQTIANQMVSKLDNYIIQLPRSRKINKLKVREEFAVSDKEYKKIVDALKFTLAKSGYKEEDIKA